MFLTEKLQRLADEFAHFEDAHERLALVVERTRHAPTLAAAERTDAHRVLGCVSVVWLVGEAREGRCFFRSDAESAIVRGLVAFVCGFFSDAPLAEVAASELDPLDALGLTRNLSPTRRNGLAATRRAIREWAQRSLAA